MRLEEFPMCCTATVLCDFGGSYDSAGENEEITKDVLARRFEEVMNDNDMYSYDAELWEDGDLHRNSGGGLVVAITTTEQAEANEFLKEKGFMCVGPYAKERHDYTGLYLWWMPLQGMFGSEG